MKKTDSTLKIPFTKMSGSGNDFIIIDNRKGIVKEKDRKEFVTRVCRRRISVGADGLILIEPSEKADFRWRYFNADGGEVEMCGNGSRCVARLAHLQGIAPETMTFETGAGLIQAEVKGEQVKVQLTEPKDLSLHLTIPLHGRQWKASFLNTGVPHVIYFVEETDSTDVERLGRETRYHPLFQPAGTNANFVTLVDPHHLKIRTYERGVEGETLACGTGAVASALDSGALGQTNSPVYLTTRGGMTLTVYFQWNGQRFSQVFLEGDARIIYSGEIWEEAWK